MNGVRLAWGKRGRARIMPTLFILCSKNRKKRAWPLLTLSSLPWRPPFIQDLGPFTYSYMRKLRVPRDFPEEIVRVGEIAGVAAPLRFRAGLHDAAAALLHLCEQPVHCRRRRYVVSEREAGKPRARARNARRGLRGQVLILEFKILDLTPFTRLGLRPGQSIVAGGP